MDLLRIIQGSWIGSARKKESASGRIPRPCGPHQMSRALQCVDLARRCGRCGGLVDLWRGVAVPLRTLARLCGRCLALADLAGIAGPSKFVECCCGGLADLVSRAGCARRRGARQVPPGLAGPGCILLTDPMKSDMLKAADRINNERRGEMDGDKD